MTCTHTTPPFAVIEYCYRDAANWKTHGSVLLTGTPTADHVRELLAALDSGELFIAEQVGLPPLQRQHRNDYGASEEDLDHAFHEFAALRPARSEEIGDFVPLMDVEAMIERFTDVRGQWDCRLSPFGQW